MTSSQTANPWCTCTPVQTSITQTSITQRSAVHVLGTTARSSTDLSCPHQVIIAAPSGTCAVLPSRTIQFRYSSYRKTALPRALIAFVHCVYRDLVSRELVPSECRWSSSVSSDIRPPTFLLIRALKSPNNIERAGSMSWLSCSVCAASTIVSHVVTYLSAENLTFAGGPYTATITALLNCGVISAAAIKYWS